VAMAALLVKQWAQPAVREAQTDLPQAKSATQEAA